jgi:hypothetical protein
MRRDPRMGSMLLLCLAMMTIMSAVVFAFVRTVRTQTEIAGLSLASRLSHQAALDGVVHALWTIGRDYAGNPSTPTHLYDPVHLSFAPPSGTAPDRQVRRGSEQTQQAPQASGNDVEVFDLLTQPAFTNRRGGEVYGGSGWDGPYSFDGTTSMRGLARWHESGKYRRDAAKIDFRPHDSTGAEVERQVWYDGSWRPTTDPLTMRYRVRYAVAVEDLSGHVLLPRQKPFVDPGATPWAQTNGGGFAFINPGEAMANEFDASWTIAGYHRSFYNIAELAGAQGRQFRAHASTTGVPDRGGFYHWQLMFQGLGVGLDGNWFADLAPVAGRFDTRMPAFGLPDMFTAGSGDRRPHSLNAQADLAARPTPTGTAVPALAPVPLLASDKTYDTHAMNPAPPLAHARPGAVYNWQQLKTDLYTAPPVPNNRAAPVPLEKQGQTVGAWAGSDTGTHTSFAYTPFGSAVHNLRPAGGSSPSVDAPWQINLLTAPPAIVRAMVFGLLRSDHKTSKYTQITRAPFDAAATAVNKYNSYGTATVMATAPGSYTYLGQTYTVPFDVSYDAIDLFTYAFCPVQARSGSKPLFPEDPRFNYNTLVAKDSASAGTPVMGSDGAGKSKIVSIAVSAGGSGYTSPPIVTIAAPATGTTATATATISGGMVSALVITNPGSGYDAAPSVTISSPPAWPSGLSAPGEYPYPGKDFCITVDEMSTSSIASHDFRWTQDILGKGISTSSQLPDTTMPERGQSVSLSTAIETSRNILEDANYRLAYAGATSANADTYWADVIDAAIHAIATARATWASQSLDPATDAKPASLAVISTIQQLDALFLGYLGYDPVSHLVVAVDPNPGLHYTRRYRSSGADAEDKSMFQSMTRAATIKDLRLANQLSGDAKLNAHRARLMERLTNDVRMSLFGSTQEYASGSATAYTSPGTLPTAVGSFAALDLDGDGTAYASFTHAIDPAVEAASFADPADQTLPVPWAVKRTAVVPFSLTGYFSIGKSHYWRILARGQAYDVLRGMPVDEINYESVYVIDPASKGPTGIPDSHIVYQRLLPNDQTGWRMRLMR